jgi:hypothetical protein
MAEKTATTGAAKQSGAKRKTAASGGGAIDLLKQDHRKVEGLFAEYENATGQRKAQIAKQVCQELIIHTLLEEEIFYPACRQNDGDEDDLDEAQVEHDGAKVLINELLSGSPQDQYFDAKVTVLAEEIRHHVAEEEKRGEGIFAKAKAAGVDTPELAQRLKTRKQALMEQAERGGLPRPQPRSFKAGMARSNGEGYRTNGYGQYRRGPERYGEERYGQERYERGGQERFRESRYEDDDRYRSRGDQQRETYGRRYEDEDRSARSRDDERRYERGRQSYAGSGREEGAYRSSARGYGEDDDDRRSRSRYSDDDNDDYGRRRR